MAHFHFQIDCHQSVGTTAAPACGPGWFESSWELNRGLEVHEGPPGDAPLNQWLTDWLRSDAADASVDRPRASGVAERHEQPRAGLVPTPAHGAVGHTLQCSDLGLAVAPEVAHLDQFGEFGVDGLELV
jgi:hypothetical protein